jgi:CheY-like chemotaxis protein/nitrogen-specific signal transduction histidine kinase
MPVADSDAQRAVAAQHFSNKMEAIARLGGGLAHQFNNLLTAILATTDLALATSDLTPSVRSDLEDIREAGRRATTITRQLLAFSGSQSMSPHPTNPNELIEQLEPLLKHVLPPNVSLELRLRSAATVEVDAVRLEQVILNLVVNSVDALSQGGSITITTRDVDGMPPTETQVGRWGACTEIIVADTGQGMDDATRLRIFEPFFSTKGSVGGGNGLGLASVYGTMHQLGGGIAIESELGQGTRVRLFVPHVAAEKEAPVEPLPADAGMVPSEVVLVVEDEPIVRAPICRMLRNLGYFVLEANNGEDALSVMQDYHSPIHLVITDVLMPKMDGVQLVSLLRDWYPRLRVLFISGYSPQHVEAQGGAVHGGAFLQKPFSLNVLGRRVREILDEERSVDDAK